MSIRVPGLPALPASREVRRAGLVVLAGSAAGFGLNFALTPVVSRLFDPGTFGRFAAVTAVASVFVGVSTFRLEVLAQRQRDEDDARDLLRLALVATVTWSLALTLLGAVAVALLQVSLWWLTVGPLVAAGSVQLVGSAALTRAGRYRALAVGNLVQGAGVGVVQVVLGWAGAGLSALLAGFVAARLVWLHPLAGTRGHRRPLTGLARRSWRYAATSGGSALVNSCAGQLPLLLCSLLFGQSAVGFLAMAIRLLVAPLGVVGQAAASATVGGVGRLIRERDAAAARAVGSGMRDLLAVGLVPCGLAAVTGVWLVPLLLGSRWEQTGHLVASLSFGALAQFVAAPFSQLLNITGRSRWLLAWDLTRFTLVLAAFAGTRVCGGSLLLAVGVHSGLLVVLYLALALLVLAAVRRTTSG